MKMLCLSIPKRTRSGENSIIVYGLAEHLVIVGGCLIVIFFSNNWTYFNFLSASTVSILNDFEKIFANFAPYPFLPPVIFFSSLS